MSDAQVHSIPAKIDYNGPANVGAYFEPTRSRVDQEGVMETATFRGRPLNGMQVSLPKGYSLHVADVGADGQTVCSLQHMDRLTVWSLDENPRSSKIYKALNWARDAIVAMRQYGYGLKDDLQGNLYGQHLVINTVINALSAHFNVAVRKKPLVLSFHGWTGGGKNYVSKFIVRNIYKKKEQSRYVHYFSGSLHFPNPQKWRQYKEQLQQWIRGNVSACGRSLFIFDEVELMPNGVLDGIKAFLDHAERVDQVDFTQSVFIFLSNTAGSEIVKHTYQTWLQGEARESIKLAEMQKAILVNVFNEKGGLQYSNLISRSVIDHFVPFLPLERIHVKMCIRDELIAREWPLPIDQRTLDRIADQLIYFPEGVGIFSTTGCKHVWQKVGLFMEEHSPSHVEL